MVRELTFSVIIPTYNRPTQLAECLQSFTHLDYPAGEWELIVVNDGGEQSLAALTETLKTSLPLTLIAIDNRGPAGARNAGARLAHGDILAFTDDDCIVDSQWLRQFANCFAEHNCAGFGGETRNPYPDNIPAATWQIYIDYVMQYFRDVDGNYLLFPSNNVAYRRTVFEALGGFDDSFPLAAAEDLEFGYRLAANGYRQLYCPAAIIWHHHRNTYWGYLRQQYRYGRGGYYFELAQQQKHFPPNVRPNPELEQHFYGRLARKLFEMRAHPGTWFLIGMTLLVYKFGRWHEMHNNR
ncbi:MAG: glycosyltransferase [Chloroflexi bacterium]|nr:MAG: glycosyltransferase [Chloroflexota bacterium]